ncbi:hypothetical protein ANTRET_LOCUS2682 [Anthophora retusa]
MEMNISPPSPLTKSENMAHTWTIWKRDFMIYMKASQSFGKPKDVKAYMLRSCIGEFGQRVIEQIAAKDSNNLYNMDLLIHKLDKYFVSNNEIQERYKFFTMQKSEKESITNYATTLKRMAETCNFGNMKDDLIRDKILAEIKDKQLLQKLFETECLDLSKLTSIWVEHVKDAQKDTLNKDNSNVRFNQHERNIDKTRKDMSQHRGCCWRCGTRHPPKSCPAWGTKCFTCNTYNHYTSRCRPHPTNRDSHPAPTAPPLLEFKNLYPDLNNADVEKTWSWMEQPQTQNESLQRTEAPNTLQPKKRENKTAKNNSEMKKEKNSCPVS